MEAVGKSVPDPVSQLVNMEDINIQNQHNRYFLLNETPGQVATILNEMVGLEIIDKSLSKIEKMTRTAEGQLKDQIRINNTLKLRIAEYTYLDQALPLSQDLLSLYNQREKGKVDLAALEGLKKVREDSSILRGWLEIEGPYHELRFYAENIATSWKKFHVLRAIKENLTSVRYEIGRKKKIVAREKDLEPLLALQEDILTHISKIIKMNSFKSELKKLKETRGDCVKKLKKYQETYESLLIQNKICPLCGGAITESELISWLEGI